MTEILIIEDEAGIAESLAYLLRLESFTVRHARRLAEGRELVAAADLIVLDLTLPDGSGLELLRQLRTTARTPVIILTSRDAEVDRVVGLELGADDYVVKPFSPREVVARVKAVLRRVTPEPEPTIAIGNGHPIAVDVDRRQAAIHGKALSLSKTEFDLLACLAGAPGRVFTRERLLDRVWGNDSAVTDRTVDAHLKAIRRKIAALGEDPDLIETVRGVGYRAREVGRPTAPRS
jgi:two-component system catabolic regulation response regulator CreB